MIAIRVYESTTGQIEEMHASNSLRALSLLESLADGEPEVMKSVSADEIHFYWDGIMATVRGTTIDRLAAAVEQESCSRCGGDGYIPVWAHVRNGICFRCVGTGIDPKGR